MQFEKSALASDLKTYEIKINGTLISEQVMSLFIFQDVFFPVWTANLQMFDMNNLIMNLPISIGSDVSITLETDVESEMFDGKKEFKFKVSHIANKINTNEKECTYTIVCVAEDLLKNQTKRVSKSYKNKPINDIVSNIISEFIGGSVDSEKTDNKLQVIIPNLNPFTAVMMVARAALKKGAADYLFFQEDDKKYIFKPFEKLFKEEDSGFTFRMRPNHIRGSDGNVFLDYCQHITEFQFVEHADAITTQATGKGANKLVEYDFVNKKWCNKDFKYGDDVGEDKTKKMWKDDIEDSNANITFLPKHETMLDNPSIIDQSKDWMGSRKSSLMKMDDNKLIIQVPGGVKGWEGLGKYCMVELPSQQDHEDGVDEDKYFKGKYFISAICHIASDTGGYFVNYELAKKRLQEQMG